MLKTRKRYFIHPGIQGAVAVRLIAQWALFVGATCVVSLGLQLLLEPLASWPDRLAQLRTSVGAFAIVSLCLVPILVRDAIRFSHRVVGPIVRLQSELRKADEVTELRPVKLRQNDFWQDLADDYNDFVERLQASQREAEFQRSAAMNTSHSKSGEHP